MKNTYKIALNFLWGTALACVSFAATANDTSINLIDVASAEMSFAVYDSAVYVTSIGVLKNISENTVEDIVIEARFFDAEEKLIDTVSESLYSIKIAPFDEAAFKLQTNTAAAKENYASHTVRVLSASEDIPCSSRNSKSNNSTASSIKKSFISWAPFLLFIAVWALMMRRYSGKNSAQNRTIDLITKQNELYEKQNKTLNRIAKAAERQVGTERE